MTSIIDLFFQHGPQVSGGVAGSSPAAAALTRAGDGAVAGDTGRLHHAHGSYEIDVKGTTRVHRQTA